MRLSVCMPVCSFSLGERLDGFAQLFLEPVEDFLVSENTKKGVRPHKGSFDQ